MTYFSFLWYERRKLPVSGCISLVLTQNEDICNFHGSLTLNKMKLFDILEAIGIMSNMIHFFILFGVRKKEWPVLNYAFH